MEGRREAGPRADQGRPNEAAAERGVEVNENGASAGVRLAWPVPGQPGRLEAHLSRSMALPQRPGRALTPGHGASPELAFPALRLRGRGQSYVVRKE